MALAAREPWSCAPRLSLATVEKTPLARANERKYRPGRYDVRSDGWRLLSSEEPQEIHGKGNGNNDSNRNSNGPLAGCISVLAKTDGSGHDEKVMAPSQKRN